MTTTYSPELVPRFEVSDFRDVSLNKVASEVYGRAYTDMHSIDGGPNDTTYEWSFLTLEEAKLDDWEKESIDKWLASSTEYVAYTHYPDAGPDPRIILADLITKGHLPCGAYTFFISW